MVSLAKVNEIFHRDWLRHDRRLEDLIGWRASLGLPEGIDRTIDWYREKLWL
jgi:nucleoside-diphosphate-sugar epimerase